ncbi:MAG: type I-E CRISPR-associated protein Cas5/CasD [Desulfovibrionaceae bacterium]|nr:type I-E CRISPR-associated protein Cas5/CasD [Desulfovibrionaceae bacterium]
MCAEEGILLLRLQGVLQSWGTASQFNLRRTDLFPSRSAIMGMLCAAQGIDRGSDEEKNFLELSAALSMKAIAVPRKCGQKILDVRRLEDFHTVQGTRKAAGGIKDCHITYRHYLMDAMFYVLLMGDKNLLEKLAEALQNPVWGLWLGRKCCIPSAPIYAGIFATEQEALQKILTYREDLNLEDLNWVEDVQFATDNSDKINDIPLSFASSARDFTTRHIAKHHGVEDAP